MVRGCQQLQHYFGVLGAGQHLLCATYSCEFQFVLDVIVWYAVVRATMFTGMASHMPALWK